ncbi:MAG: DUF58 domain-containing protein [Candidatus Thiodiazotropha sp. LLP2]
MLKNALYSWIKQFRRQAKPDLQGGVTIQARSIYILPTKQGILLAMVLLAMLAGSINYGSNLGHLATFLLGGIWITSILHTWRNLFGLKLQPQHVDSVFAGETADFSLSLINPSNLDRFGITLKHRKTNGDSIDIPNSERLPIHLPLSSRKRGIFPLPQVSLHTTYPLGLFHAWTYAQLDLNCLVYPKPAEQGEPPVTTSYTRSNSGDRGVGADDFVGLRAFRSGDSPKHIDWKAYAKKQGLLSKQFGGDRHIEIRLDWDLIPEQEPERRLSLLCRFIIQQEEQRHAYSLHIPGVSIPCDLGTNHMQKCLSALAKFGYQNAHH